MASAFVQSGTTVDNFVKFEQVWCTGPRRDDRVDLDFAGVIVARGHHEAEFLKQRSVHSVARGDGEHTHRLHAVVLWPLMWSQATARSPAPTTSAAPAGFVRAMPMCADM